jgi:membrane protein
MDTQQQDLPEIRELDRPSAVFRHMRMLFLLDARKLWGLLSETIDQWFSDNAGRLGAALAFYTVFSLAPLLIVVVGVAGLVLDRAAVQAYIVAQMHEMIGPQGAETIRIVLSGLRGPGGDLVATAVGLITLFFGASLVVAELRNALNTVWGVAASTEQLSLFATIKGMLRERFFSFTMVLGIGFLLLISLVVNAWLAAMGAYLQNVMPVSNALLQAGNFVLWFFVTTLLFGLIYKVLPDVQIAWSDVVVGATVTSLLFTAGKTLIGLYLGTSSLGSAYGAAGSLAILLAWVYYSAQVFFLGAEFTQVYANKYGSRLVARVIKGTSADVERQPKPVLTCTGEEADPTEPCHKPRIITDLSEAANPGDDGERILKP